MGGRGGREGGDRERREVAREREEGKEREENRGRKRGREGGREGREIRECKQRDREEILTPQSSNTEEKWIKRGKWNDKDTTQGHKHTWLYPDLPVGSYTVLYSLSVTKPLPSLSARLQ